MKYHLLPDKLLTQVEPNPGFWIIHWGSFAMLLLGTGLWRCLSSHSRAGKTAEEIQTLSFPLWRPLGYPEEIPTSRMGFYTLPSPKHSCVQPHMCLMPLAVPYTVSLLTHRQLSKFWSGHSDE